MKITPARRLASQRRASSSRRPTSANTSSRYRAGHPLADEDLGGRPGGLERRSFDARVLTGESPLARARRVVVAVAPAVMRWVGQQLGTLSRISARPAARARMASANTIRRQPMVVRVLLVPLASLFVAMGVALQITSGLGVGPGDMVASGLSAATGLSFGSAAMLMSGTLALIATALGRPPKMGTLVNVALIALLIDLFLPLVAIEGGYLSRLLHFGVGLWSVGLGIGCLLHARLGIGTHEALSLAISDHTGIAVGHVRRSQELSLLALGLVLGSQFGIGTFLVALFIAPVISAGTATVGKALTTLATTFDVPEIDAHVADISF